MCSVTARSDRSGQSGRAFTPRSYRYCYCLTFTAQTGGYEKDMVDD